jgi:transcriptional regulator with XRE-family HTH domain
MSSNGDNKYPIGKDQVTAAKYSAFADRLSQSAELAGFNSARLAGVLGLTRGTMARYWNGDRLPPADLLFRMADLVAADARWLVTGVHGAGDGAEEDQFLSLYRRLSPAERDHLTQSAALLLGLQTAASLREEKSPRTLHSPKSEFRPGPGPDSP